MKNNKSCFPFMSNLQTYYHFKLDSQKVDQHTGYKWLIHGTKRHKDNQLQSLYLSQISFYSAYASFLIAFLRPIYAILDGEASDIIRYLYNQECER